MLLKAGPPQTCFIFPAWPHSDSLIIQSFKEFISIQWKIVPAASFCLLVTNSPQGDNSGDFLPESTKIPYGLNESG